ncbi:Bap-like [Trichomonas vaginalis G3]|uniref:Bap-like n=1 Tax=Trichomonas vaginalis (strain ATCC PRA-98 / G3) TaxID=412133 RepID=A2FY94_TRIV3|nr:gluconolactonase protein [Trichomonas vaginalis G3]EAX90116.1 Bap-like [Trichomonas vaginalis G3]KAI5533818.1 gluconolactonase protein [Trichomonas vaginalis G3]|eukprot:XP_001303046.1 Bap-like [Trichomonas vaginalis G3]
MILSCAPLSLFIAATSSKNQIDYYPEGYTYSPILVTNDPYNYIADKGFDVRFRFNGGKTTQYSLGQFYKFKKDLNAKFEPTSAADEQKYSITLKNPSATDTQTGEVTFAWSFKLNGKPKKMFCYVGENRKYLQFYDIDDRSVPLYTFIFDGSVDVTPIEQIFLGNNPQFFTDNYPDANQDAFSCASFTWKKDIQPGQSVTLSFKIRAGKYGDEPKSNSKPLLTIITEPKSVYYTNERPEIQLKYGDPDKGNTVTPYYIISNDEGKKYNLNPFTTSEPGQQTDGKIGPLTFINQGAYWIEIWCSDGKDESSHKRYEFTVKKATGPYVQFKEVNGPFHAGEKYTFTVEITDPNANEKLTLKAGLCSNLELIEENIQHNGQKFEKNFQITIPETQPIGPVKVKALVTDGVSESDPVETTIDISGKQRPDVLITSTLNNYYYIYDKIDITVKYGDKDVSSKVFLHYQFNGQTVNKVDSFTTTADQKSKPYTISKLVLPGTPGTYTLVVWASDSEGNNPSEGETKSIKVISKNPPSIEFVTAQNTKLHVGTHTIQAKITETDVGEKFKIEWKLGENGQYSVHRDQIESNGEPHTYDIQVEIPASTQLGENKLYVKVTDGFSSNEEILTIIVSGEKAPTCNIQTTPNDLYFPDSPKQSVQILYGDQDLNSKVTLHYSFNGNSGVLDHFTTSDSKKSTLFTHNDIELPKEAGDYVYYAWSTDIDGISSTNQTITFRVSNREKPKIEILTPRYTEYFVGTRTIKCNIQGFYSDSSLTIQSKFGKNGKYKTFKSNLDHEGQMKEYDVQFTIPEGTDYGLNYDVYVKVNDGHTESSASTRIKVIENTVPALYYEPYDYRSLYFPGDLFDSITITYGDDNPGVELHLYQIYLGDEKEIDHFTPTKENSAKSFPIQRFNVPRDPGDYDIEYYVIDSEGVRSYEGDCVISFTVEEDAKPTIEIATPQDQKYAAGSRRNEIYIYGEDENKYETLHIYTKIGENGEYKEVKTFDNRYLSDYETTVLFDVPSNLEIGSSYLLYIKVSDGKNSNEATLRFSVIGVYNPTCSILTVMEEKYRPTNEKYSLQIKYGDKDFGKLIHLYYRFNGKEEEINSFTPTSDNPTATFNHEEISVPNAEGTYIYEAWSVDYEGNKSPVAKFTFNVKRDLPDLKINTPSGQKRYPGTYKLDISVTDSNTDGSFTIGTKIGDTGDYYNSLLYQPITGSSQDFRPDVVIATTTEPGTYKLWVKVSNSFNQVEKYIEVIVLKNTVPEVTRQTYLRDTYETEETIPEIEFTYGDDQPDQTISLYYQLPGQFEIRFDFFTTTEAVKHKNAKLENFKLPAEPGEFYMEVFARDSSHAKSQIIEIRFTLYVEYKPELTILTLPNQKYAQGTTQNFDLKIKDKNTHQAIRIRARLGDDGEFFHNSNAPFEREEEFNHAAEFIIPRNTKPGQYNLYFHITDGKAEVSEHIPIIVTGKKKPTCKIQTTPFQVYYPDKATTTVKISYGDDDFGSTVTLWYKFNNVEKAVNHFTTTDEITSAEETINEISIPTDEGNYIFEAWSMDIDGDKSIVDAIVFHMKQRIPPTLKFETAAQTKFLVGKSHGIDIKFSGATVEDKLSIKYRLGETGDYIVFKTGITHTGAEIEEKIPFDIPIDYQVGVVPFYVEISDGHKETTLSLNIEVIPPPRTPEETPIETPKETPQESPQETPKETLLPNEELQDGEGDDPAKQKGGNKGAVIGGVVGVIVVLLIVAIIIAVVIIIKKKGDNEGAQANGSDFELDETVIHRAPEQETATKDDPIAGTGFDEDPFHESDGGKDDSFNYKIDDDDDESQV